jgi:hypothetical protein
MSHTLKQRIDDVITMAGVYDVTLKLSRGQFARAIEFARDETFWSIFPSRPDRFKATDMFTDQDPVPDGWLGYISGTYDNGGDTGIIGYIQIPKIPAVKKKKLIKATASRPVIYLCDTDSDGVNKINTIPSGIADMDLFFYKHPVPLYADPLDETVQDNMPEDTEPFIVRGAFERLLKQQVNDQVRLKLTTIEIEAAERAQTRLYEEIARYQNEDIFKHA